MRELEFDIGYTGKIEREAHMAKEENWEPRTKRNASRLKVNNYCRG
jgi:hypothetical protein